MTGRPSPCLIIGDIVDATGGKLLRGCVDEKICGVSTDTRTIQAGNLFIPLTGPNFDGHDFISGAVRSGARAFLTERTHRNRIPAFADDIAWIEVGDTLSALGDIAHHWRKRFAGPVIAVTGSAGKTTTKEMIASICSLGQNILKTEGNFNNLVGLPLTLLKLKDGVDLAILELGTNAPGEIERLARLAEPTIGVITCIGPAHLEGLKSLEIVREEKGDLYGTMSRSGLAVFNADDEAMAPLRRLWRGRTLTYGVTSPADLTAARIVKEGIAGQSFTLNAGSDSAVVRLSASGMHNVYNALAAAALSRASGIGITEISQGLRNFHPVAARFEVHRLPNGVFLVDDTYNANPASVREALKTLRTLKGSARSVAVLADMLELGDQAEALHETVGAEAAATDVERLFLKGSLSRATAVGAVQGGLPEKRIAFFEEPEEIVPRILSFVREGDWILVKGSRRMRMEEIVKRILDSTQA